VGPRLFKYDLGSISLGLGLPYQIRSCNFDYHPVLEAETYPAALELAKQRGWEARISSGDTLVAVWSPLYGTKVYNRELAGMPPALQPVSYNGNTPWNR